MCSMHKWNIITPQHEDNALLIIMKLKTDESQNIEYKEAWNDKYLKWICGFANAQGGKIYIGVNDAH